MANKRISELTSITGANLADADLLVVVDVSDTTMASSGTNKKITMAELAKDSALTDNLIAKTTLTTDGDVLTRAAGAPARITRADLAQDSAFSSRYAAIGIEGEAIRPSSYARVRGTLTTRAPSNNIIEATILPLAQSYTFDRIAVNVTSAGESGSVISLGVYSLNISDWTASLVFDAGTVPGDGATGFKTITINQTLAAGWYLLAAAFTSATTTRPTISALNFAGGFVHQGAGTQPTLDYPGISLAHSAAALPANLSGNAVAGTPTLVYLRRA